MRFARGISQSILPRIAKWIIFAIVKTCRVSVRGKEAVDELKKSNNPLIFIFWHRHIFFFIHLFHDTGTHPLISLSQDGSFVARVAEECGMDPIRGSSSRGGARAFLELIGCLQEKKEDVLITADGPKGPARAIKEGVIRLAEKTGYPVVPISWYSTRRKIFSKSWDQFMLPLPFSRIVLVYGKPILRSDWDGARAAEGLEKTKSEWEKTLNLLEAEAIEQTWKKHSPGNQERS